MRPGLKRSLLIVFAAAGMTAAAEAQQPATVRIGMAKSVSVGATLLAIERGYFKNVGINVDLELIDSSANGIALLAQNQFQIIAGGVSAGYFNALEKDLPVIMVMSRVSSPVGHNLMLRPDLKDSIKDVKQLKGKTIATNGPGSVSSYEIGKILEPAGLTIADVDLKVFPFAQYAIAFTNKAIDAGLVIPPWTAKFADEKVALPFADADALVNPRPIALAVNIINTDWAKQNRDLVRRFYVAYLQAARDYCQGYHDAPVRKEIIELLIKKGIESRPEILNDHWPAREADGKINIRSLLDMQDWYVANKLANKKFPAERLVDLSYIEYANQQLGPFVLENKESKRPGCR